MRPLCRANAGVAAVLILMGLAAPAVVGAPLSDDYLRGYAVAVLEREFGVRAQSLEVRDGIVQISAADLGTADRSAVVAALARIEGVKRVVIAGASAVPLAPGTGTASRAEASSALRPGFLPAGQIFTPLLADPLWPRFAATLRYYINEDDLSEVGAVSLGDSVPMYRWRASDEHLWELGVQAVVLSLFDLNASSADLLTADYFVAGYLAWRSGDWAGLLRLFHQSAHLGDELAERGIVRNDFSAEGIDVKLSADLPAGFRVYGGAGYLFRRDPDSIDPWFVQAGLEFRSHWRAWQVLRPVAAIDVQSREQNDWTPALSLRAGAQFDSVQVLGRSLQLMIEYYIGDAREGQFNGRDVQYVGAGIYFSF